MAILVEREYDMIEIIVIVIIVFSVLSISGSLKSIENKLDAAQNTAIIQQNNESGDKNNV